MLGHIDWQASILFTRSLSAKLADTDVAQVFQNLAVEMSNVSTAFGAQEIDKIITQYEGAP